MITIEFLKLTLKTFGVLLAMIFLLLATLGVVGSAIHLLMEAPWFWILLVGIALVAAILWVIRAKSNPYVD